MIIKLTGADFSANNIGKIDIPKDLTEEQKIMLSKYSRRLTYNQKIAFGTLMNILTDNGITSKLNCLYMPILAGDVSEAFVNLANVDYAASFIADRSGWKLNDGIYNAIADDPLMTTIPLPETNELASLKFNNFHILFASKLGDVSSSTEAPIPYPYLLNSSANYIINFSTSSNAVRVPVFKVNGIDYRILTGDNSYNLSGRVASNTSPFMGFNSYGNYLYFMSPDKTSSKAVLEDQYSKININFPSVRFSGYKNAYMQSPMKVMSIGSGLTTDEYTIFQQAVSSFLSNF